eukprot:COSAG01_NODE_4039_length_5406_cov_1.715980_7_plen_81_part_00
MQSSATSWNHHDTSRINNACEWRVISVDRGHGIINRYHLDLSRPAGAAHGTQQTDHRFDPSLLGEVPAEPQMLVRQHAEQ